MLRVQIYTTAAGVSVQAIEFSGYNGASIAEWTDGYHFIPDPNDKDNIYPEYVEIPVFHDMRMKAYKKDMVIFCQLDEAFYTLPKNQFLNYYAATGVWETVK